MTRMQKIVVHFVLITGLGAIVYQYGHLTEFRPHAETASRAN